MREAVHTATVFLTAGDGLPVFAGSADHRLSRTLLPRKVKWWVQDPILLPPVSPLPLGNRHLCEH
jgi:hypothetical protein